MPQGSVLGPILFNIFINDIFLFIKHGQLYNYADDNTLSKSCRNFDVLMDSLVDDSKSLIHWFYINCMQANPEKFQAIAIGKKTHEKQPVFKLGDIDIKCKNTVKLLGVEIDFKLQFEQHISNLCKKAAQQVNIMKRLGSHLNRLNRLSIFHSFVLSNFNFCPLSWHFCSETNTKKIEKIQERALRFVYNDYISSYEILLDLAKIPTLKIRRIRCMALETFKILNGIAPPCLNNLVKLKENRYHFRYSNILQVPSVRTSTYGKNSFRYAAAVLWNNFPQSFREYQNLITLNPF